VSDELDRALEEFEGYYKHGGTDDCLMAARLLAKAVRKSRAKPIAWLRSLDGTDSFHPCAEGDHGCFPVYP
jgi:hypothetical protein